MDSRFRTVLFNLGDFGAPGYHAVSQIEMSLLWQGAQDILESVPAPDHESMLFETEKDLLLHVCAGVPIDQDWIGTAIMCSAVRGILYGEIPDCIFETDYI